MFKKRKGEKNKLNLNDIQVDQQEPNDGEERLVPKLANSKKINKFTTKKQDRKDEERSAQPVKIRYGLIDKEEVNSKYHANQENDQVKQPETNSLMYFVQQQNIYVKKKMEELNNKNMENAEKGKETSASEILSLQRKYLESDQKLAEYDVKEVQKKLQNASTNTIKSQLQNRIAYLKNLLENQHERMEYASKKELKTLRQQRQRLQEEYSSKYRDQGRRSYIDKMKYQAMFDK